MRFVLLGIVLAFPLFDVYVTARFARWTGVPLWVWLTASMIGGLLHGDQSLLRGLVDSGRKVLAAILLIVPGILSDVLALLLLLLPINHGRFGPQPVAAGRASFHRGDAIDADFRRMD